MDKKINIEQNKIENLECLASMRCLYSSAKNYMAFHVFFNVILIVLASIVVFIFNNGYIFNIKHDFSAHLALLSIVATVINPLIIIKIDNKKELASKIQELFDTKVLSIEWNNLIVGNKPDIENVRIYSTKYKKSNVDYRHLENWYSPKVDDVPLHIGRIICQRSNLWWDVSLRNRHINIIIISAIISFISICSLGLFSNFSFNNFVLNIATPLLPIFTFFIEQYKENRESINNLENLKQELDSYWQEIINNQSGTNSNDFSRKIQDEIFKNRKDNQLIFDWLYKIYKNNNEDTISYSVDNMIAEYKNSIST